MTPPAFIFVIGVSGCGKTTLSGQLASKMGIPFLDADDFHSHEAKSKMAQGIPLNDSDREPWIQKLELEIENKRSKGQSAVMAYSGLKRAHRNRLRSKAIQCVFLKLDLSINVIQQRLRLRKNHFMQADMLESQIKAFESTETELDVITIQGDKNLNILIGETLAILQHQFPNITEVGAL